MKAKVWLTVLCAVSTSVAAASTQPNDPVYSDPRYYEIGSVEFENMAPLSEPTLIPAGIGSQACETKQQPMSIMDLGTAKVMLDQIINMGKALFEVVKAGKPSLNVAVDVANALPKGMECWMSLANYSIPRAENKTIVIRNALDMTVVRLTNKVIWLPGGSYNNQGKYIGYATIVPADVFVGWGWSMDARVSAGSVFNRGSADQPVAGMNMNMTYRVETPFSTSESTQSYFIDGEGNYQEL